MRDIVIDLLEKNGEMETLTIADELSLAGMDAVARLKRCFEALLAEGKIISDRDDFGIDMLHADYTHIECDDQLGHSRYFKPCKVKISR